MLTWVVSLWSRNAMSANDNEGDKPVTEELIY